MALPKVVQYMKNVGQSAVYASVSNIKEDMPTIAAIADHGSNKEVYKAVYAGVKDYKSTLSRAQQAIQSSKIYQAGELGIKSAFEDIKSGKFYNTERLNKIEEETSEALFGSFDDDFDMSFGDDEDMDMSFDDDVTTGDKLVAAHTQIASMKNAEMVSNTILKASTAQLKATEASTTFLYTQQAKLFGDLRSDVINIGTRHAEEQNKSNKFLENIATNSQKFFESTTKSLDEQNAMLKEMLEMQRNMYGNARQAEKNKKERISISDIITTDGVIDLQTWGRSIAKNTKSIISDKSGGVFDMLNSMGGEDGNMLKMFTANPLGFAMQAAMRAISPKNVNKALKDLDKTISGVGGTLMARLNRMSRNQDGSPISQLIGSIFGVKSSVRSTIDPSKFEKGPVPFDGITRATINNAIPMYLSRIEAALTGEPARIYNPLTGRWSKARAIKEEFEGIRKSSISSSTSDLAAEIVRQTINSKKYKYSSFDERKQMQDDINRFLERLYENDGDFKLTKYSDYFDWGVSNEENFKQIAKAVREANRHARMSTAQNVLEGRESLNRRIEELEGKGSIYELLFSGAFDKKEFEKKLDTKDQRTSGVAGALSNYKDAKGHDLFYYLQNMYAELYRIRNSFGIPATGLPSNIPFGIGKEFRSLKGPVDDHRVETDKTRKTKDENNKRIRYDEELQAFVEQGGKVYSIYDGDAIKNFIGSVSQEDRVKAERDLANSGNFFQKALYTEHFTQDDINKAREKKGKDELKGKFIDRFKQATLTEKFQMAINTLNKATSKPAEWATDIIRKTDARIYQMLYGEETGKEDENGNKIRGMMGLMVDRFNLTMNNMAQFANDKIFDPLKKKLGVESIDDLLEKTGIKGLFENINTKLFGEKDSEGKREGGIIGEFFRNTRDSLKEKGKGIKDWFKDAFDSTLSPIKDKFKSSVYGGSNTEREYSDTEYSASSSSRLRERTIKFDPNLIGPQLVTAEQFKATRKRNLSNFRKDPEAFLNEMRDDIKYRLKNIGGMDQPIELLDIVINEDDAKHIQKIVMSRLSGRKADEVVIKTVKNDFEEYKKYLKYKNAYLDRDKTSSTMPQIVITGDETEEELEKKIAEETQLRKRYSSINRHQIPSKTEATPLEETREQRKAREIREAEIKAKHDAIMQDAKQNGSLNINKINHSAAGTALTPKTSMFAEINRRMEPVIMALQKAVGVKPGSPEGKLIEEIILENANNSDPAHPGEFLNNTSILTIYEALNKAGFAATANKLGNKIERNYGNREVDLNTFIKASPNNGGGVLSIGGIFGKATELLQKIYDTISKVVHNDTVVVSSGMEYDVSGNMVPVRRIFTRSRESETEAAQSGEEPPSANAYGAYFSKAGTSALSEGEIYGKNGLYGKVPKTGVYNIAKGTTIYPTKKNKFIELANEQNAISKFVKSNAEAKQGDTKIVNGNTYTYTNETGEWAWVRYDKTTGKRYILEEDAGLIENMANTVKSGVKDIYNRASSGASKLKIGNNMSAKEIAGELKKAAPEMTASGAIGAAIGLLAGNPLLGAAVGASMGFVSSSEQAKNWLFGNAIKDADDNIIGREGGVVSKEVQETFHKYVPNMAKTGLVGGALGLLTPFGLVGGTLLGAAAGYVKSNDAARIALFGDDNDADSGIISKNMRDSIKKKLPNIALGALGGIIGGPFGFVGNMVLGSGIGMVSTTESFKSILLGDEIDLGDGEKTRVGGIVGKIKEEVVDPLTNWGKNFVDATNKFLKDEVFKPLADNIPAITHEIMYMGKNLISFFPKMIDNIFEERFGKPLFDIVGDMLAPARKVLGKVTGAAGSLAKGTILAPVTGIKALGGAAKAAQIRRGDASYAMSAQERVIYRQGKKGFYNSKDQFANIDNRLATMRVDEIDEAISTAKKLIDNKGYFRKNLNGKIGVINRIAYLYFDDKTAREIVNACKKNEFKRAMEIVNISPTKDSAKITDEHKRGLLDRINSCLIDLEEINRKSNLVGQARTDAFKRLEKAGFKGLTDKNLQAFYTNLQKEREVAKASARELTPEEKADNSRRENANRIIDVLKDINNTLQNQLDHQIADTADAEHMKLIKKQTDEEYNNKIAKSNEEKKQAEIAAKNGEPAPEPTSAEVQSEAYGKKSKRNSLFNRIANDKRIKQARESAKWTIGLGRYVNDNAIDEDRLQDILSNNPNVQVPSHIKELGRLPDDKNIKVVYDPDSNALREFKKTKVGWREIGGKAKADADKREDSESEEKVGRLVKIFRKLGLTNSVDKDTGEKKEGFLSKIKGILGKGAKMLGAIGLGVTGAAALGHAGTYMQDTLLPNLNTFWDTKAAPWLDEKLGGRLEGIRTKIGDFFEDLPTKIQTGLEKGLTWLDENKDKVLTWYTDGLEAFSGMVTSALSFVVGNLPKILWAFGKNVLWPAVKGIGQGIMSWFKPKEVPSLKDNFPGGGSTEVNMSALNGPIADANAAAKRLGIGTDNIKLFGMDPSLSIPFVNTEDPAKVNKAQDLQQKADAATTDEEKAEIIKQMKGNAYGGKRLTEDGKYIDYYDNDLMYHDSAGNTVTVDENGNMVTIYDKNTDSVGKDVRNTITRSILTGNKGILPAVGKIGGKAVELSGKVMSGGGKLMSKMPFMKTAGKVTNAIGGVTQTTGKIVGGAGKAMGAMPTLGARDVTKTGAKVSAQANKVIEYVRNMISGVMSSKQFKWIVTQVYKFLGKGDAAASLADDAITSIYTKLDDFILKNITRAANKPMAFASKAAGVLGNIAKGLNVVAYVTDLISGYNDAESILGIAKGATDYEITVVHRLMTALLKFLNGRLLLGLIDESTIVDFLVEVIFPFFNMDIEEFDKARQESEAFLAEFNAENGTNFETIKDYNNRNSILTKIKSGWRSSRNEGKGIFASAKDAAGAGISAIGGKIKDAANWVGDKATSLAEGAKNAATNFADDVSTMISNTKDGFKNTIDSAGKALAPFVEGAKNIFSSISDKFSRVKTAVSNGDISTVHSELTMDGSGSGPMGAIGAQLFNTLTTFVRAPIEGVTSIVSVVKGIGDIFDGGKEVSISDMCTKIWEYTDTKKHPTMEGYNQIGQIEGGNSLNQVVPTIIRTIGKPIVDVIRGFNKFGDWVGGIKDFFFGGGEETPTTTGTGKYYGTSRVYQRDPRISGIPFNRSGDRSRQTIGDSGCGPAAAVNAVNYAYGTGNNIVSAAGMAKNYKELNGGTRPEFFDRYFKDNGLNSTRLSGSSEIERNLRAGNPTVLMGKDSRGGYNTPYGPNPHYITAKGIDRRGRIIVDDPENPYGTAVYNKNKVLSKTNIAISASRYGRSKYGMALDHIGRYVAEFESGSGGPTTISSGKGDYGGVSFGTYQLPSYGDIKTTKGNLPIFWKKYYASQYPNVTPGNNQAFKNAWLDAVAKDPNFQKNEIEFMTAQYYKPIRDKLINGIRLDPDKRSRGIQEMCWAMSIQFGPSLAYSVINRAIGSNWSSMTDNTIIETVSNYVADNVSSLFKSSSKDVQRGVANRYRDRQKKVLLGLTGMPALDSNNPGQISGTAGTTTTAGVAESSQSTTGNIFSMISSAFTSIFDVTDPTTGQKSNVLSMLGIGGGSSPVSASASSGSSFGSTSGGTAPSGMSDAQNKVHQAMSSIMGKNEYDQDRRHKVDATLNGASKGYGDCSSTVQWALKTATGIDPGSYTGAQIESGNGTWVDGPYEFGTKSMPVKDKLAMGDLMFYGKSNSSNPRKVSHVEMYWGDGKRVGHGSGMGPKVSDYTAMTSSQHYLGAKRFIPVGSGATAGMGSGNLYKYGMGAPNVSTVLTEKDIVEGTIKGDPPTYGMGAPVPKYGRAASIDYTSILKAIIEVLLTIADNSGKIDKIIELMAQKGNISKEEMAAMKASSAAKASTMRDKINRAFGASNSAELGGILAGRDTTSIVQAMSKIATE